MSPYPLLPQKQKTTVRHFGLTEKVYGLPCTATVAMLKWWTATYDQECKAQEPSGAR